MHDGGRLALGVVELGSLVCCRQKKDSKKEKEKQKDKQVIEYNIQTPKGHKKGKSGRGSCVG